VGSARWLLVLVRFAYLAVSNAFAMVRLLPVGEREKDVEILVLRSNPRLFDPLRGLLTPGGAAVIRSVLHGEDVEGILRREVEVWQDAEIAAEYDQELQEADRQLREALEAGDYRAVAGYARQAARRDRHGSTTPLTLRQPGRTVPRV
jgi:hypothetical protein